MRRAVVLMALVAAAVSPSRPFLVAHRGASGYAPEHTIAAYTLALEQGADYVEQDLTLTSDGVPVCLHDDTLERTTDVETRFPDRAVVEPGPDGQPARRWYANDFTLAEIKTLDAGSWFDARFAGERIPTWEEAVALIGAAAGLYPELKTPALYRAGGIDQTALFVDSINTLNLHSRPPGSLIVQSFDTQPLKDLTRLLPALARTFLIDTRDGQRWLNDSGLAEIATFATGIGPAKALLDGHPEIVRAAHTRNLTVTPYTFTTRSAAGAGRFTSIGDEMRYYLTELDVDALFTDNPDRFPR